jgi:hypothetical protein
MRSSSLQATQLVVRFGSKADMCSALTHVRFVPIADMAARLASVKDCGASCSSSVNTVTHCRHEHGIRVMSVPQIR